MGRQIYQSSLTTKRKMKNQNELIKIWKCFSDIPGWLRLLWLTGQYTEEELDGLDRIDDEFLSLSREEEIGWRKQLRKELPKTPQGWLEIFPEAKRLVKPMSRKQKKFREQLEIARSVDLTSVVENYVDLKVSGAYRLVGLCPLHDEKTPSFTIFKTDDHFYCFSCREYGDVIKFIRLVENLTFKQAVKTLYRFSQQN